MAMKPGDADPAMASLDGATALFQLFLRPQASDIAFLTLVRMR
jgi:hypothetical protein